MQELVHRMIELERQAAAAIAIAEEEAARILETARFESEKVAAEILLKNNEDARNLVMGARAEAESLRNDEVRNAMRELDAKIGLAESRGEEAAAAMVDLILNDSDGA
ncbi:MAG: hypothetical protein LBC99_07975 [Spirochaetota bacterium]|jgi:vacuolar-type H+-ATPase subunit H|nr:hypothetical protein [Spirochaetota bacterium]